MELVVFILTEGRLELLIIISNADPEKINTDYNQCLSFLGLGLCHTHLPAPQQEDCSYIQLNPNCPYAGTKTKENAYYYF